MTKLIDPRLFEIQRRAIEEKRMLQAFISPGGSAKLEFHLPPLNDSLCMLFTGYRRSGKSLTAAMLGAMALISGIRVFSNMQIEFDVKGKKYKSEPIDTQALLLLEKEIRYCVVILDELQWWGGDSHTWQQFKNRLLSAILVQMGKRHASFIFTLQDDSWLSGRLSWQVDVLMQTEDIARSAWGRAKHLPRGHYFKQTWMDYSGNWLGRKYSNTGWHRQVIFHGRKFWGIYETEECYDLAEIFRPTRVDLAPHKISDKQHDQDLRAGLANGLAGLVSQGSKTLPAEDLWVSLGVQESQRSRAGRLLKKLGVERRELSKGYVYDITGFNPNG